MRMSSSLLVGVLALGVSANADGAMITISTLSSDATDPGELDATFEFTIVAGVLKLEVTNETSAPNTFNINELYFNGGGNVTGLMPLAVDGLPDGWNFSTNAPADGFGTFEFGLTGPVDDDPETIMPSETLEFQFTILGVGPFFDTDFTTEFSTLPPGDKPLIVAAKFVFGPTDPKQGVEDNDSAFGGTIPEPGTLALLGLAGALFVKRRRRVP